MPLHITDDQALLIRDCVTEMALRRQQTGQPIPNRVWSLLAYVSACGHEIDTGAAELRHDAQDSIGTTEAARILGYTPRHVIRIANDLDGDKVGRDYIFQRRNVLEYAEGRRTA